MFFANILSPRCESVHGAGPLRHHSTFYAIAASKALVDGLRTALAIIAMMVLLAGSAQAEENPRSIGEHRVRSGDVSLWYKVSGSGPIAILPTPGWGPSADYLFLSMKPLEKNFTIVYLDTRATGRSERPASGSFTMDDLVRDLEALRAHLGVERPWFIGHSMGGSQVLEYTLRYSDHVRGLLLFATAPSWTYSDKSRAAAYRAAVGEQIAARRGKPGLEAAMQALGSDTPPASDEAYKAQMVAAMPVFMADPAKVANAQAAFDQVRFSTAAMKGFQQKGADLEPRLRDIKVPVLIVAGAEDGQVPWQETLVLHRNLLNSKLVLIPQAGHFVWIEQPTAVFAEVDAFLPSIGFNLPTK